MRPIAIACLLMLTPLVAPAQDWPQWRGPTGDNHAAAGATAPTEWSESSGLAWVTPVPGRGHSSPTVIGDRIYLTTADDAKQVQSLLVFDKNTGRLLVNQAVHSGGFPSEIYPTNTHASSTVASDGQRVFALFLNSGGAYVSAFDLAGKPLWQQRAIGFDPQRFKFGFGSSPVVYDGKVIVASEYDGAESGIVALDTATGQQVWKAARPQSLSYSTPALLRAGAGATLLMTGNLQFAGYDAASGRQLWSTAGTTNATCGTMVWDQASGLAFGSGGYPSQFTAAVRLGGGNEIVWQNRTKCYEQSMLVTGGYLYGVSDSGFAHCWNCQTGDEAWRQRLGRGGRTSSSPVLVDGKLYATNEKGVMFVYDASPQQFRLIAQNTLGDEAYATPTPVDGRLYHRFARREAGRRQEYLAAIGQ
ncbi:MAG: PQQ-binding-like beta-propeller repeat protein [Planctomycetota bacterium]